MKKCYSRFLLLQSNTKVRIWYKQHKSMDLSWLESTVQAGGAGVMVWQMFSGHTISPFVSPEYCLNARAWVLLLSQSSDHFKTGFLNMTISYFKSSDFNPTKCFWDGGEQQIHNICRKCVTLSYQCGLKCLRKVSSSSLLIVSYEELREDKRGSNQVIISYT